jgi:hypothetical protein
MKSLPYVLVHNVNNYCLYVLHICPVLVSRRGSCYGNRIVLHARFEMAFTTPRVYPNAICFFCFFFSCRLRFPLYEINFKQV